LALPKLDFSQADALHATQLAASNALKVVSIYSLYYFKFTIVH